MSAAEDRYIIASEGDGAHREPTQAFSKKVCETTIAWLERKNPGRRYWLEPAPPETPDGNAWERGATRSALARELADRFAKILGEKEDGVAWAQMKLMAKRIGPAAMQELLDHTQAVEAAGGRMLLSGERRRTPGGVFFQLAKQKLGKKITSYIQAEAHHKLGLAPPKGAPPLEAGPPKEKGPPLMPKAPPLAWKDRVDAVRESLAAKGVTTTMMPTTKLMGRPASRPITKNDCVLFSLEFNKAPSLPKGLPVPPGSITYTVFLTQKMWRAVGPALEADPLDQVIVEGVSFYDEELETHALLASSATTKETKRKAYANERTKSPNEPAKGPTKPPEGAKASPPTAPPPPKMPLPGRAHGGRTSSMPEVEVVRRTPRKDP